MENQEKIEEVQAADDVEAVELPHVGAAIDGGRGKKRALVLLCVGVVVVAVAALAIIWLGRGDPVDEVAKFAPPDLAGVAYVNIAAARDLLMERIEETDLKDDEHFKSVVELAEEVDWFAVYFPKDFAKLGPMVALRTGLTAEDLIARGKALELDRGKYVKGENGRYDPDGGRGPRIIYGRDADDLDDGMVLIGRKELMTDSFVGSLGGDSGEALRKLADDVDTAMTAWMVMKPPEGAKGVYVKSVVGAIDASGEEACGGTLVFADERPADRMEKNLGKLGELDAMKDVVSVERTGATVRVRIEPDDSLPEKIVAALQEIKRLGQRSRSAANLHHISMAISMHVAAQRARLPERLGDLVKYVGGEDRLEAFVSPASSRKPPEVVNGRLVGEIDYLYVIEQVKPKDPQSRRRVAMAQIPQPSTFVTVYERPENYGGKGTNVAFADGHVEWMNIDAFEEALAGTKKELEKIINR